METNKLAEILKEIYVIDPNLKNYEHELINLIAQMDDIKPDTKFDKIFAQNLKNKILGQHLEPKLVKLTNFNFMNKKWYLAAGSLVALGVFVFIFVNNYDNSQPINLNLDMIGSKKNSNQHISALPAGAFGDLAGLSSSNLDSGEAAARSSASTLSSGLAAGGGGMAVRTEAAFAGDSLLGAPLSNDTIASKMIMPPFYGFKYVYTGDPLELNDDTAAVYRRLKGQSGLAQDLASSLKSFGFSDLNLNTFSNLRVNNFSISEDRRLGLIINFDFNEDSIYIYENWEKWRNLDRESCGNDQACWDRFRLTINDVPADSEIIDIAKNFLNKHQINLEYYGTPMVDNAWRVQYAMFADQGNSVDQVNTSNPGDFYIPEYSSVVYPLLVDGKEVRDQSGNYAGLRVNISLIEKAVSGLNGLMPYRYETSEYALETSADNIIKLAENGGWNRNYYMESENLKTIELGTPTRSYVQLWRYNGSYGEEILVPSLIFPIKNNPADYYYGQNYIIVPLVKDILKDLDNNLDVMPLLRSGGGIEIDSGSMPPVKGTIGVEMVE